MMRSGEVITGNWKVVCSPAVSPQGQRCATCRRVLTAQVFTELQREYDGNPHLDSREGGRRGYAPDVPHGLMRLSAFARDGKNHCLRQALGYPETTIADTCVLTASEVSIMGLANIEIASPLTTRKSLRRFSRPGRPPRYSKGPNPVGSADLWKKQKRFLESGSHNNPYVNSNLELSEFRIHITTSPRGNQTRTKYAPHLAPPRNRAVFSCPDTHVRRPDTASSGPSTQLPRRLSRMTDRFRPAIAKAAIHSRVPQNGFTAKPTPSPK